MAKLGLASTAKGQYKREQEDYSDEENSEIVLFLFMTYGPVLA
jgi:hypothetical protein